MKKVVSPENVAHLWANKVQNEAMNAGRSFFFTNDTIYSYGRHFPIAKHVENFVLFTYETYSVTTAKHVGHVRGACSHIEKVMCWNPDASTNENVDKMLSKMNGELTGIGKAKKPEKYIGAASYYYNMILTYCKKMKCKPSKEQTRLLKDFAKNYLSENVNVFLAAQKEREKAQSEKLNKLTEKAVSLWRKNTPREEYPKAIKDAYSKIMRSLENTVFLRVLDGCVESTKGVKIPVPHARLIVSAFFSNKLKAGDKIEHYTINEVSEGGIIAGCHNIKTNEIEYIQKLITQ